MTMIFCQILKSDNKFNKQSCICSNIKIKTREIKSLQKNIEHYFSLRTKGTITFLSYLLCQLYFMSSLNFNLLVTCFKFSVFMSTLPLSRVCCSLMKLSKSLAKLVKVLFYNINNRKNQE